METKERIEKIWKKLDEIENLRLERNIYVESNKFINSLRDKIFKRKVKVTFTIEDNPMSYQKNEPIAIMVKGLSVLDIIDMKTKENKEAIVRVDNYIKDLKEGVDLYTKEDLKELINRFSSIEELRKQFN